MATLKLERARQIVHCMTTLPPWTWDFTYFCWVLARICSSFMRPKPCYPRVGEKVSARLNLDCWGDNLLNAMYYVPSPPDPHIYGVLWWQPFLLYFFLAILISTAPIRRILPINASLISLSAHAHCQARSATLPLSRLLSNQKTEPRSSKAKLSDDFALPLLKVKEEVKIKEEKQEEVAKSEVGEEKEEVVCPREGVSTSGSSNSTLRNSQSGANPSSSHPPPIEPVTSPFSVPPPPLFTPHFIPFYQTPQYCQTPAANWGLCGGCQCWGPIIPICFIQ